MAEQEYAGLRATIAHRGTVRVVIAPVTVALWAALALVQLSSVPLPVASSFSLLVLAGGFEAVNALHVGVERIGRYLQVFYEEATTSEVAGASEVPKWETTAMHGGPALPGGGVDPLFTVLFGAAVALNLGLAVVPWPTPIEAGFAGAVHLLVLIRIVRARVAAGGQRVRDLEHYRRIRDGR